MQGRLLGPLMHREEFKLELPREVVESVVFESSRRKPGVGVVKPVGEWYVVPNRNRMCFFRGEFVSVRVWPRSGSCRVLPCRPMPFGWVQTAVQTVFFKAGVDLRVCEGLSQKLDVESRHRIFKVGPVTPFKIKHYRPSLGLTILADGSHPNHIETEETTPGWVRQFLSGMNAFPKQMERIANRFEENMEKHLKIIDGAAEIIRVFREESVNRDKALKELLHARRRKDGALTQLAATSPESVPRGTRRRKSRGDEKVREIQKQVENALERLRDE